jgi:hypothetical protein
MPASEIGLYHDAGSGETRPPYHPSRRTVSQAAVRAGEARAEPGVVHYFGQLLQRELADPAAPHQYRGVAIKVRRGEERRILVLDQGLLVGLQRHPEHDHVGVALAGARIGGVGPGGAEEHEDRPPSW